jgi:uncharacterized RDD family membrane protein YckC
MTGVPPLTKTPEPPPLDEGPQPQEPLLTVGFVVPAATAVLYLLVQFSVPLTNGQQAAILGALAALLPIVTAAIGRRRVYSPESVRLLLRSKIDPQRIKRTGQS